MRTDLVRRRTRTSVALVVGTTIAMLFVSPGTAAAAPAAYTQTTLPLQATALNDKGLVVGSVTQDGVSRAATWQHGKLKVLALPQGATSSVAADVNDSGLVGGTAFVDGHSHAVIWANGKPSWLPEPPPLLEGDPVDTQVQAVNNAGDVVGSVYREPLGWRAISWPAPRHASKARGFILTSSDASATDLNKGGIAVGIGESGRRAVRWSALGASTSPLQPLDADRVLVSGATGVNDAGQVVGAELDELPEGGAAYSAVLWRPDGTPTTLPQPTPAGGALPDRINNRGQIVGELIPPAGGPSQVVLWADGKVRLLGVTGYPVDLNDAGAILVNTGGGFALLTPSRGAGGSSFDWRRHAVWGHWSHVKASLEGARKVAWKRWLVRL